MSEGDKISQDDYGWLNEALFEGIIANELSDCVSSDYNFKLTSIKPAVGKGENYVSLVTRVELEVDFVKKLDRKPKIYNFIVKSSIQMLQEIENMDVFEKEMQFYDNIAASFRKLDPSITCFPKYYSVTTEGRKLIIMNDLTTMGYKMQDRLVGLDLEHCKLFFKTIAQFHALGAVHYEKYGRYDERFHQSPYRMELKPMNDKWGQMLYTEFLQIFDRYECLKPYREKFHKWKETMFETLCDLTTENLDEFNVLNHGDDWVNNMLFRHNADGKPDDLCFVDFQISRYDTPITDIMYFFVTSPNLDVREHHFDELLHVYQTNLAEYLEKYEYPKPIPTMRDVQMMVLKYGILGPFFLNAITPIILLDSDNSRTLDYFVRDDEEGNKFRYKLYNTPRYIKAVEVTLKFFDRRGLLDF